MRSTQSLNRVNVAVRIEASSWTSALADLESVSARAIEGAASRVESRGGEVAVLFTSDAEMQRLNQTWRRKDKPTDVLSFPSPEAIGPDVDKHLGDIALGVETCTADAATMGRDMAFHVSHLVVHGFLHLLGYDHEARADAEIMEQLEAQILGELGWPDPYVVVEIGADRA